MNTSTPPRPRVKPERTVNLGPIVSGSPNRLLSMTFITRGPKRTKEEHFAYWLRSIPGAASGFRLEKVNPAPAEGEPDHYDLLLEGKRSTCECKGFLHYGHCKHVDSLRALVQCGKLSVPMVEQQPAAEPIAFDDP
jgi:hypothetical protein